MSFSCLVNHPPHSVSPVPAVFVLLKSGFDSVKTLCVCVCLCVRVCVCVCTGQSECIHHPSYKVVYVLKCLRFYYDRDFEDQPHFMHINLSFL